MKHKKSDNYHNSWKWIQVTEKLIWENISSSGLESGKKFELTKNMIDQTSRIYRTYILI